MVEHGAVPRAAKCEGDRRNQARARARNQSRDRGTGGDAANPQQGAEDVTQLVGIDRNDMSERHGDDVEQAAVEVEIFEGEEIANPESTLVIRDDQLAIAMLHGLIVGDRVVLEGEQRDDDKLSLKVNSVMTTSAAISGTVAISQASMRAIDRIALLQGKVFSAMPGTRSPVSRALVLIIPHHHT